MEIQRAEWACAGAARVLFRARGAVACWAQKGVVGGEGRWGWWKGEEVDEPVELRRRSNVGTRRGNILAGGESCGGEGDVAWGA